MTILSPMYMQKLEMSKKKNIEKATVRDGDSNTQLSSIDRTRKKKSEMIQKI